ncbi:MAG: hypothetical protein K2X81_14875 [Candidatus Obscuribacterales bacterium]|nr:hypothetical protein [Candidatus Obscuribacterales bacterium]
MSPNSSAAESWSSKDVAGPLHLVDNNDGLRAEFMEAGLKNKPTDRKSEEKKLSTPPAAPDSALGQIGDALKSMSKNGFELTPDLKKQFENAIAKADSGDSPRLATLNKELEKTRQDAEKILTPERQKTLIDTKEDMNSRLSKANLSAEQKQAIDALIAKRESSPKDKAAIDAVVNKIVPGLLKDIDKLESAMKPVLEAATKIEQKNHEIELEQKQSSIARVVYAEVLYGSGDKAGARQQLRAAAVKDQSLLQDETFAEFADELGLSVKDLKLINA